MIQIGSHTIAGKALLAPMAGVSDQPFRNLCRQFGAALACSEMLTSNIDLWHTKKSACRLPGNGEQGLNVVQIAGTEPAQLAAAARRCEQLGADIIDINMGCPAKKVCKKQAGSALMQNETLVAAILEAVVAAVAIPVTLKIRTGWDKHLRNGPAIAALAEDLGVQAVAVHGRTRACRFEGNAEYDTIARVAQRVSIPVFANGDITSPEQAKRVLAYTGAAGVMIGRGAFGRPWLFAEINRHLGGGASVEGELQLATIIRRHLTAMHRYYGEQSGVRVARKHLNWYLKQIPASQHSALVTQSTTNTWQHQFNQLETAAQQLAFIDARQYAMNHPVIQGIALKERRPNVRNQAA